MTPEQFQDYTNQRLANVSTEEVQKMYGKLRGRVMAAHRARKRAEAGEQRSMVAIGHVLETRMGEDEFCKLMDKLDSAPATPHG